MDFYSAAPVSSETARGQRLDMFIQNARSFTSLPRHRHVPDFRILPVEEPKYKGNFFWILDGEQRIGLMNLEWGEIELFRFLPPMAGEVVSYEMPAVYHWATLRGARLTVVPQGTWTGKGKMTRLRERGEEIRLRFDEVLGDGAKLTHAFTLRFDPLLGYVLDCAFELRAPTARKFEYGNLLAGGLAESRDERKRYQKCIWTRRDGTLSYMYQNPRSLMQLWDEEWTDLPEDGGFVGFVAERDMNPFIEVFHSEPHTTMVTCDMWYDQHLFALPAEKKGTDGLYHTRTSYRMLSLPHLIAKELEDAARVMLPVKENARTMGFLQGVVNDFENPIPTGIMYNGCVWGRGAQLDTQVGHSGSNSLRVDGHSSAKPIYGGTAIYVDTGKRYRLSAWVRTQGVTGQGAYLLMEEVFYNWNDIHGSNRSEVLTGDNEWTRLEVEFTPVPGDPFAVPVLVVEGEGSAWFDDIELIEIGF